MNSWPRARKSPPCRADPPDTIARELMHLGPDRSALGDYLSGWRWSRLAGPVCSCGATGMRAKEAGAVPVTMADYLAVRLVLERICCEKLVPHLGLPLFLSELGDNHFPSTRPSCGCATPVMPACCRKRWPTKHGR